MQEQLDSANMKLKTTLNDHTLLKRELEKMLRKPQQPPPLSSRSNLVAEAFAAAAAKMAKSTATATAASAPSAPPPPPPPPPPVKKNPPPPPPAKKAAASTHKGGPPSLFPNPALEPPSLATDSSISNETLLLYLLQSGCGEEVRGLSREELLALAKTRTSAWEIRRIIACSTQNPPVRGYNMTLYNRNPSGANSLYKELMLKVGLG